MSIVSEHLNQYLLKLAEQGLIQTSDGQPITEELMVHVYVGAIGEGPEGRIAVGFVGYLLGVGADVIALDAHAPRTVALATIELLKPYAGTLPIVDELLAECDKYNSEFLQNQEIDASGATNVTKLH